MRTALEGLRILDLTQVWAGPTTMRLLGDFGADVIKVESAKRFDSSRGPVNPRAGNTIFPDDEPGPRPWNRAGLFNCRNRSKRGICLDLTHPRGVSTFRRLVRNVDIVAESFRVGVMERFGLDYRTLLEDRPDLIMISLSSQGQNGPERSYVSFGATLEQTGGLASVTGYRDGGPTTSGAFFPDPVVGTMAVGVILAAVRHRTRTGRGSYIDLSQREVITSALPGMIMDYTMNGRVQTPLGNRHPVFAPQGVYPCRGDDAWIAITVRSDEAWSALATLARDETLKDPAIRTAEGRRERHDDLDERLARWTATRDPYELMDKLQRAGIAAGVVQKGDRILEDPQLQHRGFWEDVGHPEAGTYPYLARSFKVNRTPGLSRSHAPILGEHTAEVLREVGGLSDEEIRELAEMGVTANVPLDQ